MRLAVQFGINMIDIGTTTVFTIKLRFKDNFVAPPMFEKFLSKGFTIVQYVTTSYSDFVIAKTAMREHGMNVAIERLLCKYPELASNEISFSSIAQQERSSRLSEPVRPEYEYEDLPF